MELLSTKAAAEILGISPQAVRNLIENGVTIDPSKVIKNTRVVYRVYKSEIDRLLIKRGGKGRLPRFFTKRALRAKIDLTDTNQ